MQLIVVLHNIRSTYNVGAILRSCDGFGVERAILSGYTPKPGDPNLLPHLRAKLDRQIAKTALGAEATVPQALLPDAAALQVYLQAQQRQGWKVLALENNLPNGQTPELLSSPQLRQQLGEQVILLLGEEVAGIAPDLLKLADFCAEIPMRGQKESFNVSVAASLAMYELLAR